MKKQIVALTFALALSTPAAFAEPNDAAASRSVIESQISAFKADDGARAFSYAAPAIKQYFPSSDAFMTMVRRGYQPVYAPRNYTFGRFMENGGRIVQEVLVTGPQGKEWTALYTLEKQDDGSLLITGCRLVRSDALAI